MNWLLNRLLEASTWRGLVWLLTVSGVVLRPDQVEAIVLAGMALAGLLGVFLKDQYRSDKENTRERSTDARPTTLPPIELVGAAESPARNPDASSFVPGADPARNRRVTDQWMRDPVPSESGFKHSSDPRQGTVGWNDDS